MNRLGLIIYAKSQEKVFNEILVKLMNKYKGKGTLGYMRTTSKGIILFQIRREVFKNYSQFDNFLFDFANNTKKNKKILVIGHNDKDGYIWTDYNG